MNFNAPHIDYAGLSPVIALTAGVVVVLLVGLLPRVNRFTLASLTIAVLAVTAARCIIEWSSNSDLVAGALRLDAFGLSATLIACTAAAIVVLLAIREPAAEEAGHGAFYALLLGSVLGMTLIAQAQNLVAFFVALELLSIPLYVLSASARRQERSLESGLKYLIIGSIGSATVLYGFALLYGASGSTDFSGIAHAVGPGGKGSDTLVLIGTAMVATGLAFKTSLAPFHQWTPDVYQGAPTPVTAFMAVATKAAAFIALARLFEVALGPIAHDWKPALAAIAVASIAIGNIGALGQDSLKRLMGYSGIAQAGYMLAGSRGRDREGTRGAGLLPGRLHADEPGGLRRRRRARARDRARRRHRIRCRPRPLAPAAGLAAHHRNAGARRTARHLRLHGQALPDRGDRGRRLHLARSGDRGRARWSPSSTTCGSSPPSG